MNIARHRFAHQDGLRAFLVSLGASGNGADAAASKLIGVKTSDELRSILSDALPEQWSKVFAQCCDAVKRIIALPVKQVSYATLYQYAQQLYSALSLPIAVMSHRLASSLRSALAVSTEAGEGAEPAKQLSQPQVASPVGPRKTTASSARAVAAGSSS